MLTFDEQTFRGLDLSRRADEIAPGYLTAATNVVLDGDDLLTRPGADGQLASPLANPLRAFTAFDAGALFVSGGASTGKLYYWVAGATTRAEVTLPGPTSLALTTAGVQMAQAVSVAFLVDGVGSLTRATSSAATTLTELDRPAAPTGTIYHQTLQLLSSLTWSQNYITDYVSLGVSASASSGAGDKVSPMSSITQTDGNFWDGSNLTGTALWSTRAGAPAYSPNIQDGNQANAVELDSDTGPGDSVQSGPLLLNPASVSGYARVGILSYEAAAEDASSNSMVVEADVVAYSDTGGTTAISGSTKTWRSPFLANDASTQIRQLIDLRGLATAPRSIRVGFTQPMALGTNQGADVNRVALYIPRMELGVVADADNRLTVRQGSVQVWQGFGATPSLAGALGGTTDPASSAPGRLLTAGLKITAPLGTSQNWTGVRTLGLEMLLGAGVSGLSARLGFKVGSTWYYTEALDIPAPTSPESTVWATGELRDIAANLTAVSDIALEILSDVMVEGLQEGGDAILFRLGELRNVGNLPEGRPVWYKLVEMDEAGDSANLLDVVYSDGSPSTPLIEATRGSRMARLVLPARTNSGAEWFALYRFGGGYLAQDGTETAAGRLVALISWATGDFAFGGDTDKGTAPRIVAFANPYISWDKVGSTGDAGSILIDNTPDSWLSGADFYLSGREKAPSAPSSIAAWDNRLWLGKGSDLFASWRLSAAATAGVYWSRLQLPEAIDPEAGIKGHWERLSLASGDSIQRMVALPEALLILTKQRVFRATATSAVPLYDVKRLTDADAAGIVSPWAACELDGRVWWLSGSGLRVSDGQSVQRVGAEIYEALKSVSQSDLAAARLSACPSSRKLFLSLGSSLYVYHAGRADGSDIEKGWTLWSGLNSLLAADVAGALHLAGESGQIWKMTGDQDDAGPISAAIATRRFSPSREFTLVPTSLGLRVATEATETLTITITGDTAALSAESSQSVPEGEWEWAITPDHTVEGKRLDVSLEVVASAPVRVRGLSLEAIEKRRTK